MQYCIKTVTDIYTVNLLPTNIVQFCERCEPIPRSGTTGVAGAAAPSVICKVEKNQRRKKSRKMREK